MATMIVNKLNCQLNLNMGLPSPVNKKGEKERDSYLPRIAMAHTSKLSLYLSPLCGTPSPTHAR